MKYETVIFDFDGTLADTRDSITHTIQLALRGYVEEIPLSRDVVSLIGLPIEKTLQLTTDLNEAQIEEVVTRYRQLYDNVALKSVVLFSNVYETLKELDALGLKLAIASSKGEKSIGRLNEKLHISEFFDLTAGVERVAQKKPSPEIVLYILNELNSRADKTLVVGDTTFDILMGQSANCTTCGVSYGNHSEEELMTAKPDYVIDDFSKLLTLIQPSE